MGLFQSRKKPPPPPMSNRMVLAMYGIYPYNDATKPDFSPVAGARKRTRNIIGMLSTYLPDQRPITYCSDLRLLVGGTNVHVKRLPDEGHLCCALITVRMQFRKYYFVGKGRTFNDACAHAYYDAYVSLTDQQVEDESDEEAARTWGRPYKKRPANPTTDQVGPDQPGGASNATDAQESNGTSQEPENTLKPNEEIGSDEQSEDDGKQTEEHVGSIPESDNTTDQMKQNLGSFQEAGYVVEPCEVLFCEKCCEKCWRKLSEECCEAREEGAPYNEPKEVEEPCEASSDPSKEGQDDSSGNKDEGGSVEETGNIMPPQPKVLTGLTKMLLMARMEQLNDERIE